MSSEPNISRARKLGRRLFSSSASSSAAIEKQKQGPWGRSTAVLIEEKDETLNQKRINRRSSLFDLFNKPKVEKARGFHDPTPAPIIDSISKSDSIVENSRFTRPDRSKRDSRFVKIGVSPQSSPSISDDNQLESPSNNLTNNEYNPDSTSAHNLELVSKHSEVKNDTRINTQEVDGADMSTKLRSSPASSPALQSAPRPASIVSALSPASATPYANVPTNANRISSTSTPTSTSTSTGANVSANANASAIIKIVPPPTQKRNSLINPSTPIIISNTFPPPPLNRPSSIHLIQPVENWDPPPLFQVFPQSVKHGRLQGVNSMRNQSANKFSKSELNNVSSDRMKRLSLISDTPEVQPKIFVLVTAGRLVQYAGSGHSDRTPEKILRLNSNSAAFACDLIPGAHWVIQILQNSNDIENNVTPSVKPSRSLLSRIKVPKLTRKHVTSLLMVFESADEMEGWLKSLRFMIQTLGGKPIKKEIDPEKRREHENESDNQKALRHVPSHRYLIQKDPQKFHDNRRDSFSPVSPTAPKDSRRLSLAASVKSGTSGISGISGISGMSGITASSALSMKFNEPTPVITSKPLLEQDNSKRQSSIIHSSSAKEPSFTPSEMFKLEPLRETSRFSSKPIHTIETPPKSSGIESKSMDSSNSTKSLSSSLPKYDNNSDLLSMQRKLESPNRRSLQTNQIGHSIPVRRSNSLASSPIGFDKTNSLEQKNYTLLRQTSNTPTIIESDSERTSFDFGLNSTRSSIPVYNSDKLIPSIPKSRNSISSTAKRSRPFAKPLPIKPRQQQPSSSAKENNSKVTITTTITSNTSSASTENLENDISPIRHLEILASELQMTSALREARSRMSLNLAFNSTMSSNASLNKRMSLQNLPSQQSNIKTGRYSNTVSSSSPSTTTTTTTTITSQIPNRRTSSISGVIPERRSSVSSFNSNGYSSLSGNVSLLQPIQSSAVLDKMNHYRSSSQSQSQLQSQSKNQNQNSTQTFKLKRPTSMQIRSSNAPFLSSSRQNSISSSKRSTSISQTSLTGGNVPLVVSSQNAAPAPFVPYSKALNDASSYVIKENQRFSIRASTGPKYIPPSKSEVKTSQIPHRHTQSQALPDTQTVQRSASPAFSNTPNVRHSFSSNDLSGNSLRRNSYVANTSVKRLSLLSSRPKSPPPKSESMSPRNSLIFEQQENININLAALRGKHNIPTMNSVGLPPPLPPPTCPLPRLPTGISSGQN